MALNIKQILPMIVALVILGAILTLSLNPLISFGATNITIDETPTTISEAYPSLTLMVGTLLPILAIIAIAYMFMKDN